MALQRLGRALMGSLLPSAKQASLFGSQGSRAAFGAHAHDDHHDDHHHEGPPATTPTAFDKIISLNVVDLNGHRHAVKSLVGKNLAEALVEAGFPEVCPLVLAGAINAPGQQHHVANIMPDQPFMHDQPNASACHQHHHGIMRIRSKRWYAPSSISMSALLHAPSLADSTALPSPCLPPSLPPSITDLSMRPTPSIPYPVPPMQTYFFPNMGFYTQHLDDAHVFIPKDFWPKMPSFEDDSDEADAIKRMFKLIVQVGGAGVGASVTRGDTGVTGEDRGIFRLHQAHLQAHITGEGRSGRMGVILGYRIGRHHAPAPSACLGPSRALR